MTTVVLIPNSLNRYLVCACLLFGVIVGGCDIPSRPILDPADAPRTSTSETGDSSAPDQAMLEPPGDRIATGWETWDAYFIGGSQVGYAHVTADLADDLAKYTLDSRLLVKQGRSRLLQQLSQQSTETIDGQLIDFESLLQVGPVVTEFRGVMARGNLGIETVRGSSRTSRSVPWEATYRGLVAMEQSLRHRPMMKKGQHRTLKMLLPGQYQLATVRFACAGKALVPLIDGTPAELLETNCEIRIDDLQTFSTIWTDEKGEIVRTFSPALQLVTYRTDQSTAMQGNHLDWPVASIRLRGRGINDPSESERVAYKVKPVGTLGDSDEPLEFKPAPEQYVRPMPDGSFQVLVSRRPEATDKGFIAAALEPSDGDLRSNHFIDSAATLVRRYAESAVVSTGLSEKEIAAQLTKTAYQMTDDQPDAIGFAKASQTARDGVASATQRAILLAALMRARRIPSRLAIGLKYEPRGADQETETAAHRMNYHVWTLAHVDGKWTSFDATEGTTAAADRLIFSTTDLSGGNENESLVPFLSLLGKVEVEVVGQN